MRMRSSAPLLVVALSLGLPGCFNKAKDGETENPDAAAGTDGATDGEGEAPANRASGSVASREGSKARKPKVRLKAAKPMRVEKLVPNGGGGDEGGGETKKPKRAAKKKLELAGFAPTASSAGGKVEIFGAGFSGDASNTKVTVGGVDWTVDEVGADRIVATVPEGAKDGKISVKSGKGKGSASGSFVALTDDGAFGKPGPVYNGLIGAVYAAGADLNEMPDFSSLGDPTALIAVGPLDIASTEFEQGLPGTDGRVTTNFAIRFTGSLNITEEGEYDLCINADDGAQLFLEETMVLDLSTAGAENNGCELIYLEPGEYSLRIDYFQGVTTTVGLQFLWGRDGGTAEPVPADVLFRPADPVSLLP